MLIDSDINKFINILTGIVDKRESAHLAAVLDGLLKLVVRHAVPNVLDVAQHKVLDEDAVGAAARRQDVGQVGQLLDHDDRVVERRLELWYSRDGFGLVLCREDATAEKSAPSSCRRVALFPSRDVECR